MNQGPLALTYASFVVSKENSVDAKVLKAILEAAQVDVSDAEIAAFVSCLSKASVCDILAGLTAAGNAPATEVHSEPAVNKISSEPVEPQEEEDDDMGFGLFD